MMNATLGKKFLAGLFAGSALCLHGAIVTNTWIGATGGSWTNAANWSDSVMLGTNDATCAFFDLSALPSNATNSIPYIDGGIRAYGLRIGSDDGAETDTWLINREGTFTNNISLLLSFQDDGSGAATLDVRRGVLRCDGQAKGYWGLAVLKTGAGSVRLVAGENGNWRIADGAVVPCDSANKALWQSTVRLMDASGRIDASFWPYGVELQTLKRNDDVTEPMPLDGGQIYFGAAGTAATLEKDYFSGTGTLSAHGDQVLTLSSSLPSFTGTFRLENGDITMTTSLPGLSAHYAFEDSSNVGAATRKGPALVTRGSPAVVSDATRGNVLSLDGASYLAHADATKLPEGFPSGSTSFTIGFWVKPATDADNQATLFYLGTWGNARECLLIRLQKSDKQLMFTNYGNNTFVDCEKFYDGNWHHLAVRYEDGKERLYLDGAEIGSSAVTPEIKDGEFWIGTGKNDKKFKGLMDDFVVATSAIDVATLVNGVAFSNLSPALNPSVSIVAHGSGTMNLCGTQTVAQISGDVPTGRIRLDGGLKITGTAEALATTYPAEIAGAGDLVKEGADYDLTLSGANTYTGVTRVVAGTLGVKGRKTFGALAGRWTFEDAAHLGRDSGDFGFDLDVSGATAYADETRGNVVKFDGNAKLSSTALPDVFPTGNSDYTLSLWLKGETSCDAAAGVCVWGTTGTAGQSALWRLDGTSGWMMTNWGDNHLSTTGTGTSFRDGKWHHVVWIRKSTQRSVYVDGVRTESWYGLETIDVQKKAFTLGMNPATSTYFTGCMDDVRLYAFALTDDEAKAEYAGAVASSDRSGVTTGRPDPVYRWTFDDAADPWANTGTATDGTLAAVGLPLSDTVDDRAGRVLNLRGVPQGGGDSIMSYLKPAASLASLPSANRPFTVSCWARMTWRSQDSTWMYWGGEGSYFMLFGLSYDGQFRCTIDARWREAESGIHTYWAPETDNKWRHFAASYDGSWLRIYEDGLLVNTVWIGANINMDNSTFWIGRKKSSATEWFHGYLDDVEIYDTALSGDQILSIVRDERLRASEPVLPASAVVEVSEGATFRVEAADLSVSQVKGAGSIEIGKGATLGVTECSAFSGTVTGYGTFGLAEGVTIETDETLAGLPVLSAPQAKVTIPATGTVTFDCAAKDVPTGTITLATGASVSAPADLSGWKVEPELPYKIRFRASPTAFELLVLPRGFTVMVR